MLTFILAMSFTSSYAQTPISIYENQIYKFLLDFYFSELSSNDLVILLEERSLSLNEGNVRYMERAVNYAFQEGSIESREIPNSCIESETVNYDQDHFENYNIWLLDESSISQLENDRLITSKVLFELERDYRQVSFYRPCFLQPNLAVVFFRGEFFFLNHDINGWSEVIRYYELD